MVDFKAMNVIDYTLNAMWPEATEHIVEAANKARDI